MKLTGLTLTSAGQRSRRGKAGATRSSTQPGGLVIRPWPFPIGAAAWVLSYLLAAFWVSALQAQPEYKPAPAPVPQAPPPPLVGEGPTPMASQARQAVSVAGQPALYSIGEPTDEEQLMIEWLNRARANPAAEGERLRATTDPFVLDAYSYFGLDANLMVSQFAVISPAPPLVS